MLAFLLLALLLSTAEIELGGKFLRVEIADSPKVQSRGLMGRTSLPSDSGMLFVYQKPEILSFWMKDTSIPLSIGFFDEERVLINVENMNPLLEGATSLPTYESKAPALYALEVAQGWFEQQGIRPGAKFAFRSSSF